MDTYAKVSDRDRKFAELNLADAAYELSPDGLCVFDRDLRFRRINTRLAEIHGLPAVEHLGKTFREVVPQFADLLEPICRQVIATGESVLNHEIAITVPSTGKLHYMDINIYPLRDANFQVAALSLLIHDITKWKLAEEILLRRQADLNRAQAVAQIGNWRVNDRNELSGSSEIYRIFGIPEGKCISREAFLNLLHPDDRNFVNHSWEAALRGEPFDVEYRIVVEGKVKWVRARAELEFGSDGALLGGFGTVQDITRQKETQEILRRYELLAEHSRDIILFTRRSNGKILEANAAATKAYGYTREELLGKSIWDLRSPESLPFIEQQMTEADMTTVLFETLHRRKDGSTFPVEVSAQGATIGGERTLISVIRDITKRKRVERELAEAKSRQEILADLAGHLLASEAPQEIVKDLALRVMGYLGCDVFLNYLVEPRGGLLRLNACAGIDDDEANKAKWLEISSTICGLVASGGSRFVAENIPELEDSRMEMVKFFGLKIYACYPLIARGNLIGTLSFGSRRKTHFFESDLALIQSVTNYIAIALERVRVQRALSESEIRYRTIARSIPDGAVLVADREMRLIIAEGSIGRQFGLTREEMEGQLLSDVFSSEESKAAVYRFSRALKGESTSTELEFRNRILWAQCVPLRDERGNIEAAMGLYLDITERKRLEEQLRHTQKLESIGVLAGGLAHDFNNLLTSVLGNASLAQMDASPVIKERLDGITTAAEKAAALTRQLLAYAGKGQFEIRDFDPAKLIRSSYDLIRISIPKNIEFELKIPEALAYVKGDPAQIQQIVMNLAINAAEAIEEGQSGTVTVGMGMKKAGPGSSIPGLELAPGEYIFIEVRDTGCGMDEETRRQIFDPFFTTKFLGRGLGLAAVQGILRSHKGAITVESKPGQGSVFTVYLPCVTRRLSRDRSRAVRAVNRQRPASVLVVDDEPAVSGFVKNALERMGHTVKVADNGREALDLLARENHFDLVMIDIVMPVVGGGEALVQIREKWPELAILITSGYNREEARRLGTLPDDIPFIEKPYKVEELANAIQSALKKGGRAQRNI